MTVKELQLKLQQMVDEDPAVSDLPVYYATYNHDEELEVVERKQAYVGRRWLDDAIVFY